MLKLQKLEENESMQEKYEQIIEYLKQDNGYWLNNDKWDFKEKCFFGKLIEASRYVQFHNFQNEIIKNELKFFVVKSFKEEVFKDCVIKKICGRFKCISLFLKEIYPNITSITDIVNKTEMIIKWNDFLTRKNIGGYKYALKTIYDFLQEYYDETEEIQKDIWYAKKIKGARIPASVGTGRLDFTPLPLYYREEIKRYFAMMVTRKSYRTCAETLSIIKFFFEKFYQNGYKDGFLKSLTRQDIEKYIYWLVNEETKKDTAYKSKCVTYIQNMIKYMQIAEYSIAPKIEEYKLFYQDDIPKRESNSDIIKRVKYIPTPILEQIDNNIDEIKNKDIVAIYKLLRETGWRGTDILNLRYNNCLEQIWNAKENKYNYYLCGEITKTGIAGLKVPIHEEIAHMVKKYIEIAKNRSNENNNPKKYLFNTYTGKSKGRPVWKLRVVSKIQNLIDTKKILDTNGKIYHFKMHTLRHTRAKEYIEQGLGIEIVQQMLGHRSLQMTIHYATVSENILYEKWKKTEELQLFKVNEETKQLEKLDIKDENNDRMIRYEYVKKNLDAVKVPFGICFKSQKLQCKNQIYQCLECASFCTSIENIDEYETEIVRVRKQIEIAKEVGRTDWIKANNERLEILEKFLQRIKDEKIVHKNGNSRGEC